MSLIQFLRILIARRWIILATAVSCLVVALIVGALLPKRYEARARIMLDVVKPDPVTGRVIATQFMRGYTRTQTELIKDYRVAGEVVDKLGWPSNPAIIAQWQAATGGTGDVRRWSSQRIIDSTDAGLVEGSNILEIIYSAPDPQVARQVVSLLREAYIDASLRFRTDSAGRTADWYREQADKAQIALRAAEKAKSDFERANNIVLTPTGEAETVKLAALQTQLMSVRGAVGQQEFAASQAVLASPAATSLQAQLAQIDDGIQQVSDRLGTSHPTYKAYVARRQTVAEQLAREENKVRQLGGGSAAYIRKTIGQLESEYKAQREKVLAMAPILNQFAQLLREVELRRSQYDKAAARTAELRLEADVSETGLVVLGDAIGDNKPSFPNIPLIGGLAALFGLGLGIAIALFTEMLARRVRGAEDLSFATKAPVLAVIADSIKPSRFKWLSRFFNGKRSEPVAWQPAQ